VTRLVAVPNVSEGRDEAVLDAIGDAFATHADVLDRSSDPDHHRAVFFLAGDAGRLHRALAAGAAEAAARIDLNEHDGLHPRVGALDVAPVVFLDEEQRGAAIAEALLAADGIGAEGIPVFL
jgi:glutamate formiminotransferase / 5-formyltetrahydrofolate cyclo-ligase